MTARERSLGPARLVAGAGGRDAVGVLVLGIFVVLVVALFSDYWSQQVAVWLIYGMLALSFTFVWGKGGIFSFGQSAFFGIGAYAYGVVSIDALPHTNETITAVVAGILLGTAAAAIIGYFMFYGNLGDVYVAIVTLAVSLVLYTFMSTTAGPQYHIGAAQLGGFNGMTAIPPLTYGVPGSSSQTPVDLHDFLRVVGVIAVVLAFGVRWLLRAPFGRIVVALRANEQRTELLGYDVRLHKLLLFSVGGAIAGLAGALFAAWGTFIDPSVFALQQAAFVAIWVLIGGRRSIAGAFLGAALVEEISNALASTGSTSTPIVLGAILIGVVLLLPQGLVPTAAMLARRIRALRQVPRPADVPAIALGERSTPAALLQAGEGEGLELGVDGVHKVFGGVAAVNGVDLRFPPRGVECIIGPNGAGKSTLFNLLVGSMAPSEGNVVLGDERITRWRPHQRARRGIGIKLQVASLYQELSTAENVWLASYARLRDRRAATERAAALLEWLGLTARAAEPAGALSHGEQQWLEIGMVVASQPRVILLDEPTAGMSRQETTRTAELVKTLAEYVTVVVVEHDMDFVRALRAPITVLHEGKVFARGTWEDLRKDGRVLDIYLGRPAGAQA